MVVVDRRSKAQAEDEDNASSDSSYEWVTDSEDEGDAEVTEKMVQASMTTTLLSMVPLTKAYREANDAMFELNDIKGMQAEVGKCKVSE